MRLWVAAFAAAMLCVGHANAADNLSPLPVQHFVDNNGVLCVGCKLFTYQAGTTTKQNTYTDSSGGTPNTNPVILNARGEANVWLDPSLSYKFVLSPSTDSDLPTNPFWTVDQILTAITATQLTTVLASPPPIGATTPNTGAITSIGVMSGQADLLPGTLSGTSAWSVWLGEQTPGDVQSLMLRSSAGTKSSGIYTGNVNDYFAYSAHFGGGTTCAYPNDAPSWTVAVTSQSNSGQAVLSLPSTPALVVTGGQ